ncbi:MAG: DUF169 domain-containing protein [Kiloniellales bacterium]
MSNADYANQLVESLGLDDPPVAIAFLDQPPAGVAAGPAAVPSACAFWREAEKGVFFATAERHFNCPIGSFVMGFDLPKAISDELMELIGTMTKCGYIAAEEPGHIPTNEKKSSTGALYGPLEDFPVAPDAVVVWLTPAQAMIWSEAAGSAEWGGQAPASVRGRPACATIPAARAMGTSALSLGCAGMRTFTGVAGVKMLAVIAGSNLGKASGVIAAMRGVNDTMEAFYRDRAAKLTVARGSESR